MKTPLKHRLFLVPGKMGARYPYCNSLLIDAGERAILDPGSNRKDLRELATEGVGAVFLSHYHSDHLRDLREFPAARVFVHEFERDAVESWEGMAPLVWFPEEERDETWTRRKNREVGGWGWPVSETFADGSELLVGDARVIVLHTPGHTPGHCSFWFPDDKVLFAADIDLTEFGPWYGNAASDLDAFLASVRRLQALEPELTVTGHEAGVIAGDIRGRLESYARIIAERHRRILAFLETPRTHDELVAQAFMYGAYYSPTGSLHAPEWRMVKHHLDWGIQRGEVKVEGKRFSQR